MARGLTTVLLSQSEILKTNVAIYPSIRLHDILAFPSALLHPISILISARKSREVVAKMTSKERREETLANDDDDDDDDDDGHDYLVGGGKPSFRSYLP